MPEPIIRVHELRVAGYGFRIVTDPSLPVSVFRLINANGGGIQYDADTRKMEPLYFPTSVAGSSPAPEEQKKTDDGYRYFDQGDVL